MLIHKICLILRQSRTTEVPQDCSREMQSMQMLIMCNANGSPIPTRSGLNISIQSMNVLELHDPNLRLGPVCRPSRRTFPRVAPRPLEHPRKPACPSACHDTGFFFTLGILVIFFLCFLYLNSLSRS